MNAGVEVALVKPVEVNVIVAVANEVPAVVPAVKPLNVAIPADAVTVVVPPIFHVPPLVVAFTEAELDVRLLY